MESALSIPPGRLLFLVTFPVMALLVLYEWLSGKYRDGRKTAVDWQMFGLSLLGIMIFERPVMTALVYLGADRLLPSGVPALLSLQDAHPVVMVIAFILIDELVHGAAHNFAHARPPKGRVMAKVHAFYREAHRGHHLLGGPDGRGEVSVTHSVVAGWGWLLFLPNYWLGGVALALGLGQTWLFATLFKNLWGMHVHTNWSYDLYLLNHPNRFVRRAMTALCHVLTFPNQHHQHHARGPNSAANMQNVLALYDWLFWGTLVIERERPAVYGWKQRSREQRALYRYLHRPLKTRARPS